jgi:hypothetical protein
MSSESGIYVLVAASALLGSIIGGLLSFFSSYYLGKKKFEQDLVSRDLEKRSALYGDFMAEVGRITLLSLDGKIESASEFGALYSLLGRIRIVAPKEVADAAAKFGTLVTDTPARDDQEQSARHEKNLTATRDQFIALCQADLQNIKTQA